MHNGILEYGSELLINSPLRISKVFAVLHSPGTSDVIATLPLLQHFFTGLQGYSWAKEGLFKLHLCEQQTAIQNTQTHTSLLFIYV